MRHVRTLALPLVLLLAAACAKEAPGYEGPYRRQVRAAIPQIEESIGLTFKTLPVLEERSRDEVREFVIRQFQEQVTPIEMAGLQQAYRMFGLLPDTLDLQQFMVELLTEQIAGYYDPAKKVLYVVRDAPANQRDMVIAHELVHALQDQHTSLDSTRSLKGDNDRMVAMHAVVEGQATYETILSQAGGTDLDLMLPSSWDMVREGIRAAQSSMPKFASAPTYIQETAIFPYLSGAAFMRQFKRARGGRSPYQPFASSTEQILHPERYLADTPDVPTRVTLAAPRGGSLLYEDNLGEFEIRLFLYEHLRDLNTAVAAADGWDGDRFQVVSAGGGAALGWVTVWDNAVEAAQFREALQRLIERRYRLAPRSGGDGEIGRWTARGRRFLVESAAVGDRAIVIYEDVPAAMTARILTRDRVSLQEP